MLNNPWASILARNISSSALCGKHTGLVLLQALNESSQTWEARG